MNLTELAKKMNVTRQYVGAVKNGNRNILKGMAERLEKATGISRGRWMFPERYGEPWTQLEKLKKFKD